ncbi:hypothetical protein PV328_006309 [Microctonus aethiopoides]|uniref:Death domain-containing protein n=1 Tax=Microctonus aethiopoides TaxID=144406 RepID=A0AA39FNT6_9HYME|nr:hypothetical protein PV328_006309 [Microctonus aethiopoides]
MHYFVAISLFIIFLQNVAEIKPEHNSKKFNGQNLKKISDLDGVINNLALKEDYNEDYVFLESTPANKNEKHVKAVEEIVPFQSFMPVDRTYDELPKKAAAEIFQDTTKRSNEINDSNETQFFENLKHKFRTHSFNLSPLYVSLIILVTILVTCCCTVWLRNRIVACFKTCWPSKKKRGYDSLDSESGKKEKVSKLKKIRQKYSRFPSPRAKSLSKDYSAVETVDNVQNVQPQSSEPPPPPPLPSQIVESASSTGCCTISGTIDVNLSQFEYLASHMDEFECRQLIAALHYITYDLPQSMAGAIRKIDENTSCLSHLLHWNSSPAEGKGQTHEHLQHRLRQINRIDLADWLGKSVFKELSNDLNNILDKPFGALGVEDTKTQLSK